MFNSQVHLMKCTRWISQVPLGHYTVRTELELSLTLLLFPAIKKSAGCFFFLPTFLCAVEATLLLQKFRAIRPLEAVLLNFLAAENTYFWLYSKWFYQKLFNEHINGRFDCKFFAFVASLIDSGRVRSIIMVQRDWQCYTMYHRSN